MSTLHDQNVYITGGTSGIGLAMARVLAARGAHVLLMSRRPDEAALASVRAAARTPAQRIAHATCDVADRTGTLAAFARAAADFGEPDVVVNSAGIGFAEPFVDMSYENFDATMQVNLYGSRHVAEAALQRMRPRGRGRLVFVSSMAGIVPVYGYTAYGGSKFGVLGFAECLRYELKPLGIDVACVCPGQVATPLLAKEAETIPPACKAMKAVGGTMAMAPAAEAIVRGLERGRSLIIPGLRSRLLYAMLWATPRALWLAITDAIVRLALRQPRSA